VDLARDRGLEVVAGRTDRLAGRLGVHFLDIFETTVRVCPVSSSAVNTTATSLKPSTSGFWAK
jgi:hypothetical protein